jgi:hypothetical protein
MSLEGDEVDWHVLDAKKTEATKSAGNEFSVEIQTAVRSELDMMLTAPIFAQSNRCKSFLSYVVLQTLSGNAGHLKERTIGISVFDRANDYATGEDSIVRVTANEVRKRIGQFYRESPVAHPVQIELPKGAYVPEFRIRPSLSGDDIEQIAPSDSLSNGPSAGETPLPLESLSASPVETDVPPADQSPLTGKNAPGKSARKLLVSVVLPVLLLVTVVGGLAIWRGRSQNKIPQIWDGFLNTKVPVLICLGAHDIHMSNVVSPAEAEKFSDLVLHRQVIPIDDATVLTSMASVLGKKGIPFRIAGANQTSLTDLRMQPVILIGAADNKWTLRLTQGLRYRIEVVRPRGPNNDPIASIVDREQPANGSWKIDFSIPMSEWKKDYAIVARLDDTNTGVPVLIEAGLGNDGSLAASESITSGALMARVTNEPQCRGKSNFEAVVGTDIIDEKSGPPHVLRLNCW